MPESRMTTGLQGFQAMSFAPGGSTPEEFDQMIRADIDTFIRMAKLAGLRAK